MENKELIGKTKEEVIKLLKGKDYRITREDDIHYMITCDYREHRLNLTFDNNILTRIKNG